MAELLLSLTIIGVVAAITLPALTGNINERTWNTQRKALYSRMSQAISLMPAMNGYGITIENEDGSLEDNAAETFITEGLSKVLKINNICDYKHIDDCGFPNKVTRLNGEVIASMPNRLLEFNESLSVDFVNSNGNYHHYSPYNTYAAAFETQNGESILFFYNNTCSGNLTNSSWHFAQPLVCANFIYDLNGKKGPNTVGKDIGFITSLYPSDPKVVAPMLEPSAFGNSIPQRDSGKFCNTISSEYRVPNIEELISIFFNYYLLAETVKGTGGVWSSSVSDNGQAWTLYYDGGVELSNRAIGRTIQCIRR